jgi:hypothetical protein
MTPRIILDRHNARLVPILAFSSLVIVSSLFTYIALAIRYLYVLTEIQQGAPVEIKTDSLQVRRIACVFPRSGTFGAIPRITYYILLVAVVILRHPKFEWVAAGAAASALTYSGVAAVYQVMIFVFANRLNQSVGDDNVWLHHFSNAPLMQNNKV